MKALMLAVVCVACGGSVDPAPQETLPGNQETGAHPVESANSRPWIPDAGSEGSPGNGLVCRVVSRTGVAIDDVPCERSEFEWSWSMCPESTCAQVETCNRAIYLKEISPGISYCRTDNGRMGVIVLR